MILTLNDKLDATHRKLKTKTELVDNLANIESSYVKVGNSYDYSRKVHTQSLFYIEDNIESEYSHQNYMEYLQEAWNTHAGIVITPDILWYALQCELSGLVISKVNTYRDLFTTSQEKQEIKVRSDSMTVMPLDVLMDAVKAKVPSDISGFLPEFSTSTQRSVFARFAAFCDMVSPYYNYSMYCCGFPAIDVRGDAADWQKMRKSWQSIGKLFTEDQDYINRVDDLLGKICGSLGDVDFWKDMFSLERCGSGSQYIVLGWINDVYLKTPSLRFVENYSSHISIVKYKQLDTNKDYEMKQGLISSKKEENFLVPDFAHIIYEKREETKIETKVEYKTYKF
jgi:hypothetical protein